MHIFDAACFESGVEMPTIRSVETILVQLPTRREHKWTGLTETIGRYLLTRITDSDGRVGWGEAPAVKDWGGEFGRYFGESTLIAKTLIENYLGPALIGVELGDFVEMHARMDAVVKGYPYSKAALDFAAYDVTGRWLNVPVYTLLGGKARSRVLVTHSIGLISIAEAAQEVAKVAAEGIKTIKIKIGLDPKRDIEMVRTIRETVGDDVELCVDANEGYRTAGE